ncbi:MAG: isoprenylcysteine carboxylmethyltransferase family protein [Chloroflexales bacterium]|nr:isoprenylcysteine carboxylmethyltransferase family protein [Chloroflexales bacterium]
MRPQPSAHTSAWRTAEVVFGLPFLCALALQWLVPLGLPREPFGLVLVVVGVLLSVAGVVVIVLGRRELAAYDQPTDPGYPTRRLVTTGVYGRSRNPLYLGAVWVLAGIALAGNLAWALVMLALSVVLCQVWLITPEEHYLAASFGEEYRRYTATVRRWI